MAPRVECHRAILVIKTGAQLNVAENLGYQGWLYAAVANAMLIRRAVSHKDFWPKLDKGPLPNTDLVNGLYSFAQTKRPDAQRL